MNSIYATSRATVGGLPTPYVPVAKGAPVSIMYYTDTRAAVVTRVSPSGKTVTVARVETGPSRRDMACDEGAYGLRPTRADGILTDPIPGTEQTFRLTRRNRYENQGCYLILGRSTTWVDHRR